MRIPKRYGESRIDKCPFCGMQATTVNSQKVPVCSRHKNFELENLKCLCGDYLDIKHGKYGVFFSCMNCGNINLKKALEINDVQDKKEVKEVKSSREETVRSDDIRYFD